MKKIAIVCGAPSSEFLAPFDDPEWEIWVLGNRLHRFEGRRVTRVFEIHDDLSEHGDVLAYKNKILEASEKYTIVVGEKFFSDVEQRNFNWIIFDYECSIKLFGSLYLTSSPAYMMSQAISEGATHIGIYGVDLSVDNHEYFWQRPCMEAWIAFAKGRGIQIEIPKVSPLGRAAYVEGRHWDGNKNKYGVGGVEPFTEQQFLDMASCHEQKIQEAQAQIRMLDQKIHLHSGAKQAYERLAKVARSVEAGNDIKSLSETSIIK